MSRALLSCDRPVLAGRAGPQQHVQGALHRGDQPCGSAFASTEPDRDRGLFTPGEQTVGRETLWQAGFRKASRFVKQSRQPVAATVSGPGTAAPFLPRRGHAKTVMCDDPIIRTGLLRTHHRGLAPALNPRGRRVLAPTPFWRGYVLRKVINFLLNLYEVRVYAFLASLSRQTELDRATRR
jgi:hypothetical protein